MAARIVVTAALLMLGVRAEARETFQLGGTGGVPWADWGELTFIDAKRVPGSIRPFETESTHNLVSSMRDRGGDVRSLLNTYTLDEEWVRGASEFVVDGDTTTAYVHPPRIVILGGRGGFWTVPMFFDLGAPFLVERIRFFTRADFPQHNMRQYVLWFNDGSEETKDRFGDPLWSKYHTEIDNLESDVVLDLDPPRTIRHIRLRPGTEASNGGLNSTWEVAEVQVFGRGFVPSGTFVSEPIPLGQPSSLGHIRWGWQLDEGAQIVVQTRSGTDDQPYVYWRSTGVGTEISPLDERGRELTRQAYSNLANTRAGITDDLTNWSPWQTYETDGSGTPILSPSPRAFVQVRVQFTSAGLAGGQLDSLAFDYSMPPVRNVVGEIHPVSVEPATSTLFTYAVRSRIDAGQSGFDALRLRTAAQVDSITAVRIDRETVPTFTAERDGDDAWVVSFTRVIRDQTLLEVDFMAKVFRYGTPFNAAVLDTEVDEVPQEVEAGDAVAEFTGDDLKVRIGLQSDLIAGLRVSPNPFTPNGDGHNDVAAFSFSLLRLTSASPVTVSVFDLSGRLVRRLQAASVGSQAVDVEWTGTDDAGDPVPPGLYLFRLSVDSDGGSQERVGHVAVAY